MRTVGRGCRRRATYGRRAPRPDQRDVRVTENRVLLTGGDIDQRGVNRVVVMLEGPARNLSPTASWVLATRLRWSSASTQQRLNLRPLPQEHGAFRGVADTGNT